jgi:hypothetical protein
MISVSFEGERQHTKFFKVRGNSPTANIRLDFDNTLKRWERLKCCLTLSNQCFLFQCIHHKKATDKPNKSKEKFGINIWIRFENERRDRILLFCGSKKENQNLALLFNVLSEIVSTTAILNVVEKACLIFRWDIQWFDEYCKDIHEIL